MTWRGGTAKETSELRKGTTFSMMVFLIPLVLLLSAGTRAAAEAVFTPICTGRMARPARPLTGVRKIAKLPDLASLALLHETRTQAANTTRQSCHLLSCHRKVANVAHKMARD